MNDLRFMRMAISLARRGHGDVAPNPSVGCVIVKNGRVVGRGWTQSGGRPHAETEALFQAGKNAAGADVYVTLEPCAHHGKTPPCADALIAAGVARVVVGVRDPDPRVDGGGIRRLRSAGIVVVEGICELEARDAIDGFLSKILDGRPSVTVKAATTLDGRIATSEGASRWITGAISRSMVHGMRARHDAIMIGAGTAITDDPSLTCRLPGLEERSPIRVIVCGKTPIPLSHNLVRCASEVATMFFVNNSHPLEYCAKYKAAGINVVKVKSTPNGNTDLSEVLFSLGSHGVTRLMVEGGGKLISTLLKGGLVDRLVWFRAPKLIGGDGVAVAAKFGVGTLDGAANFVQVSVRSAGDDLIETYVRKL